MLLEDKWILLSKSDKKNNDFLLSIERFDKISIKSLVLGFFKSNFSKIIKDFSLIL